MKELPNVTMVIVDCVNYGEAVMAINKSLEQIKPHSTIFFTDKVFNSDDFEAIMIKPIKSKEEYSKFIIKELWRYITTSHILIIQNDGYVLDGSVWTDEFLEYDYIGAPWFYKDGRNVGNGGFSLRSKNLMVTANNIIGNGMYHPEDEVICRLYRNLLDLGGAKFANEELAHQFSYECHEPLQPTFGFHGKFHPPYQDSIIIKRSAAMGDIIMMEPVMEYFHKEGYRIVLDIPPQFFGLFQFHSYPVYHITQVPHQPKTRVVNLDMAYEIEPKKLVLKSYYKVASITDGEIRNARLDFRVDDQTKMFSKYIVLHIDNTAMEHRNIHGVDWVHVAAFLKASGYDVIQAGTGPKIAGLKMNTPTMNSMMYLMAGASYFIGIDSGCSHVAVGLGIESIIFSGSVNLKYRYADHSKIHAIQNVCPINHDGCYHSVVGVSGVDCVVEKKSPPCITFTTDQIISKLNEIIK